MIRRIVVTLSFVFPRSLHVKNCSPVSYTTRITHKLSPHFVLNIFLKCIESSECDHSILCYVKDSAKSVKRTCI